MATADHDPPDLTVKAVRRAAGPTSAAAAAPADAADAASQVSGAPAPDRGAATDAVAQALSAGTIDAEQAKLQLIDQAVAAALPTNADASMVAAVRAEVAGLLESDPVLRELLRR